MSQSQNLQNSQNQLLQRSIERDRNLIRNSQRSFGKLSVQKPSFISGRKPPTLVEEEEEFDIIDDHFQQNEDQNNIVILDEEQEENEDMAEDVQGNLIQEIGLNDSLVQEFINDANQEFEQAILLDLAEEEGKNNDPQQNDPNNNSNNDNNNNDNTGSQIRQQNVRQNRSKNYVHLNNENEDLDIDINQGLLGLHEESHNGQPQNLPEKFQDQNTITPFDCFSLYLDPETIEHTICEQSNIYFDQYIEDKQIDLQELSENHQLRQRQPCTIIQFYKYLACKIIMMIFKRTNIRNYWTTNPFFISSCSRIMSRDDYEIFERFLHLANNRDHSDDLDSNYKIRSFYDLMNDKFQHHYTPGTQIVLDERVSKFYGRCFDLKTYNPNKPYKYGIFEYVVSDSKSFYTYQQKFYSKSDSIREKRQQKHYLNSIVKSLTQTLEKEKHHIYLDNKYSQKLLFEEFSDMGFRATGTARIDRCGLTNEDKLELSSLALDKFGTESFLSTRNGLVHLLLYMDRKKQPIKFLTNSHNNEKQEEESYIRQQNNQIVKIQYEKPKLVCDYNTYTHGVDLGNQIINSIRPPNHYKKWWKVIFQTTLGSVFLNSYVIYKSVTGKHITFIKYLEQLLENLNTQYLEIQFQEIYQAQLENKLENYNHFLEKEEGRPRICMHCKKGETVWRCTGCFRAGKRRALHPGCSAAHQKSHLQKYLKL